MDKLLIKIRAGFNYNKLMKVYGEEEGLSENAEEYLLG